MRPDQVPEGGKARFYADASLDETQGVWGDLDMLCVTVNTSGYLVLADADDCMGVIFTSEGRRPLAHSATAHKEVVGGAPYTLISRGEFVEANVQGQGATALAAGDRVWAKDGGDVGTTMSEGDTYVGVIDHTGNRLIVDVGLMTTEGGS